MESKRTATIYTKQAVNERIYGLISALHLEAGYQIDRAVLFGSYAKGGVKPTSDIDLALWSPSFEGYLPDDLTPIASIVSRFHPISIRTFPHGAKPEDFPFIREIEKGGIEVDIHF